MKRLQIDSLLEYTKNKFSKFNDVRASNKQYSLGDIIQSGLVIFSLKDSSLLEFNKRLPQRKKNLERIYKIKNCPPNSQMREVLDEILPIQIEKVKWGLVQKIKEEGLLKEFDYLEDCKLLLIDGVHHFSSKKVSCSNCLTRKHEDGTITYSHSMLSAVIAHPEKKEVIPLCEEPIIQQDGVSKNDCELNASNRLLKIVRTGHLTEKFIRVEDALYANGSHIKAIKTKGDHFIIRVKPGSVIQQYEKLLAASKEATKEEEEGYKAHKLYKRHGIIKPLAAPAKLQQVIKKEKKVIKVYHFANRLYLNEEHKNLLVNFIHYEEKSIATGRTLKRFEWITDFVITEHNMDKIVKAGRCRWKIENETFNTLKNQGYHFSHNFGHGEKHLCTNFALLMMLAFLIDQIQQLSNKVFQEALKISEWKKYLWDDVRSLFKTLPFDSMDMIYQSITHGIQSAFLAQPIDSG